MQQLPSQYVRKLALSKMLTAGGATSLFFGTTTRKVPIFAYSARVGTLLKPLPFLIPVENSPNFLSRLRAWVDPDSDHPHPVLDPEWGARTASNEADAGTSCRQDDKHLENILDDVTRWGCGFHVGILQARSGACCRDRSPAVRRACCLRRSEILGR